MALPGPVGRSGKREFIQDGGPRVLKGRLPIRIHIEAQNLVANVEPRLRVLAHNNLVQRRVGRTRLERDEKVNRIVLGRLPLELPEKPGPWLGRKRRLIGGQNQPVCVVHAGHVEDLGTGRKDGIALARLGKEEPFQFDLKTVGLLEPLGNHLRATALGPGIDPGLEEKPTPLGALGKGFLGTGGAPDGIVNVEQEKVVDGLVFNGPGHPLSVYERLGAGLVDESRPIDLHAHVNEVEFPVVLDKAVNPHSVRLVRHIVVISNIGGRVHGHGGQHVFDLQGHGRHAPKPGRAHHCVIILEDRLLDRLFNEKGIALNGSEHLADAPDEALGRLFGRIRLSASQQLDFHLVFGGLFKQGHVQEAALPLVLASGIFGRGAHHGHVDANAETLERPALDETKGFLDLRPLAQNVRHHVVLDVEVLFTTGLDAHLVFVEVEIALGEGAVLNHGRKGLACQNVVPAVRLQDSEPLERQPYLILRQDAQPVLLGHGGVSLALKALGDGQEGGGIDRSSCAKGGLEFILGMRNPCIHIFG